MTVYLVQHAEAMREEEDPQRPLTPRGWQDIRAVAAFLARSGRVPVARIVHSGKTRAQQTAEVLAEALRPSQGVTAGQDLDPLADPRPWVERLQASTEAMMLVGHLPHLSKVAALLLCQDETRQPVAFQMGGVVCLQRNATGQWAVQWMVVPALLAEGG
ncbi:MAG: phosphohistidine phosphatase SixA [Candidatus Tectimicrobiota bacterium]|nr:MAG: phosphohistidine phosphatase SixA [Candidatus Tectomicrobia bacterium]